MSTKENTKENKAPPTDHQSNTYTNKNSKLKSKDNQNNNDSETNDSDINDSDSDSENDNINDTNDNNDKDNNDVNDKDNHNNGNDGESDSDIVTDIRPTHSITTNTDINILNNRVNTIEKSMKMMGTNIQTMLSLLSNLKTKSNDKEEQDDDISINDTITINQTKTKSKNKMIDLTSNNHNHNTFNNNHNNHNNYINQNEENDEFLQDIIKEASLYIAIDFIDFQDKNINPYEYTLNDVIASKLKTDYERDNEVIDENNENKRIPDQLLSQTINNDIYATDGVADNDIQEVDLAYYRNSALNDLTNIRDNWNKTVLNNDDDAIIKLLNATTDPTEYKHNIDRVNEINNGIAGLFQINQDNKILLDIDGINSIQIAEILTIDNDKLNLLFEDINRTLLYDKMADNEITDPNKRVKNGSNVLYTNIPKLNNSHIDRIHEIIGYTGNRLKLDPDSECTLQHYGQLLCISADPNNNKLHWDIINTPFRQLLTLNCIRNILFNINMRFNTHPDIDNIRDKNESIQLLQLSMLANAICKHRKTNKSQKDAYWVTNRKQWNFCGDIITYARKLHTAIGTLNKKLFKYGCGKRLLHRTNWNSSTLQLVGDTDQSLQKTFCRKLNNLKRAYELQISEQVILAQFHTIISLHDKLQKMIKDKDKIETFSKTLAHPNAVDFNENLFAMFKKTEIAIAGASRSTAEFRLDAMKLIRDLLNWRTLIKQSENRKKTKKLEDIIKNDISTLNLIINGELRGSEQRREKLTNRLIHKCKNGPNIKTSSKSSISSNSNNFNISNNSNNNNNHNYNKKRRKLNKLNKPSVSFNIATDFNEIDDDDDEYRTPAISLCKNMFNNAKEFNTNDDILNNKRMEMITQCLSTFHREDIKAKEWDTESIDTLDTSNTSNVSNNRKRNFYQMYNNKEFKTQRRSNNNRNEKRYDNHNHNITPRYINNHNNYNNSINFHRNTHGRKRRI